MFPVADAHCDFLYYMVQNGYDIRTLQGRQSMQLDSMQKGGVKLQFFACWIDMNLSVSPLQQCLSMIAAYHRMLDENTADMVRLTEAEAGDDRIQTVLTIEGGEAMEGRLENLAIFRRLGVRAMTLTWNSKNDLAYPATGKRNLGLTQLGKETVDEMCKIGIAVDVAHLSDTGIDTVLSRATRPIFASHSNARTLINNRRAILDEHVRAIAAKGGLCCVNFYPAQLTSEAKASIEDIVRHIDHMVSVAGPLHVGLGSDFDGMSRYPEDMQSSADFPALLKRLSMLGYDDETVQRIAYGNLRDFIVQFR